MKRWTLLALVVGMGTSVVSAHDVWLVKKGGRLELLYGHEIAEVYNPVKVREYKGYDKTGKEIPLELAKTEESFGIEENPKAAMIIVNFDNGYWIAESSAVWKNVSLEVAKEHSPYHHPLKYHKSLYDWSEVFAKPVGIKMEVLPLGNPFSLKPGDSIQVQVFFDGKPLPNAKVEYEAHSDKAPSVQSDAEGKAKVPVSAKNEQFIAVDYAPDVSSPEQVSYSASLRFELR